MAVVRRSVGPAADDEPFSGVPRLPGLVGEVRRDALMTSSPDLRRIPARFASLLRAGKQRFATQPALWALAAILVLGGAIRLYELATVQVLWFDEISSYYVPFLITHRYGSVETWGLLRTPVPSVFTQAYQLVYSTITGMIFPAIAEANSPFWVRIPAVVSGLALIALLYGVGTELFNRRVGLAAALLAAVVPWTVYWSRFAGVIAPLELWPVAAIYAALVAVRLLSQRLLMLSLIFGAFTVYTHEAGIVALVLLILPFWFLCARRFLPGSPNLVRWRGLVETVRFCLPFLLGLVLALVPLLLFEFQPVAAGTSLLGTGQLVWERCPNLHCTASTFLANAGLSWSPDFLGLSGGLTGAQAAGFETHISIGGAWQSGGGFTGMLTVLGLLAYPALLLLALRWPRRLTGNNVLASWLVVFLVLAYTVVGGVVYYDNPNSARLAFAAGLLIVVIAWLIVSLIEVAWETLASRIPARSKPSSTPMWLHRSPARAKALVVAVGVCLVVAPVGGAYLYDYFEEWPGISPAYFYPQIQQVGEMLSQQHLWSYPLVVLCPSDLIYILPAELAFYDPNKPPHASISVFNGSVAANTGPLSSSPTGLVFVSMVNSTVEQLRSSGVPATALSATGGISTFWIPGSKSDHDTLDSIEQWNATPVANFSATSFTWNVTQFPTNGSLETSLSAGGLAILAQLPANASNSSWSVRISLNQTLPEPAYNFLALNWSFSESAGPGAAWVAPVYWNGTTNVTGSARQLYPNATLNAAPISEPDYRLSGFEVGASIASDSSQATRIVNASAYGVVPTPASACSRPQVVLLGSIADVASPDGSGLNYTAENSTLLTSLCIPPSGGSLPVTYYAELSVEFVSNLTQPLTFSATAPGFASNPILGITSPPGTTATIFAGLEGPPLGLPEPVRITIHFVGTVILESLTLIKFVGGPPAGV